MPRNYLAFVLFAAAMLFSMVREWAAPVACIRPVVARAGIALHR